MDKENNLIQTLREYRGELYYQYGLTYRGARPQKSTAEHIIEMIKRGNFAHYDVGHLHNGSMCVYFYSCYDME